MARMKVTLQAYQLKTQLLDNKCKEQEQEIMMLREELA